MVILLIALCASWVGFSLIGWVALLGTRTLPSSGLARLAGLAGPANPAADANQVTPHRVSVIIAARDEARRIGDTVERLLEQTGVDLDLTVVNDRSTDGTGEILTGLAKRHPQLRVLHLDSLPEGWLGKPHACHHGARDARGDWLLFSDADAWMSPDVVSRAIDAAIRDGAQHVALFPGEEGTTLLARASMTMIMTATAPVPAMVNRDVPRVAAGIGAFNLVQADAYRKSGGYERLAMAVVDDLKLGWNLRASGARSRLYDANLDLKVHWAENAKGLLHAVEKNMFALFGFRAIPALLAVAVPLAVWLGTLLAPIWGAEAGRWAFLPLLGMLTVWLPTLLVARRGRLGALAAFLGPLTVPLLVGMISNSTIRTLRQGGIRWRETFYPLKDLRRGL